MSIVTRTVRFAYFSNLQRLHQPSHPKTGIFNGNIRTYSSAADGSESAVQMMQEILRKRFPKAKKISVNDLSGGCGSMYEIFVETVEFKGLPLVKQHMLINQTLKEQIKDIHGLTVKTKVADVEGS